MRLLVTADIHYNHRRSRAPAEALIAQMNAAGGDGVLVVGDTACLDGDWLERCLGLFSIRGPKLFVAGNHELWTNGRDSLAGLDEELPRRVRAMGWHWLTGGPWRMGGWAIVGNVGWYDYSFAPADLGIPRRFFEAKMSPGAAATLGGHAELLAGQDISPGAMGLIARWNDGVHVKLGMSDEQFLERCIGELSRDLASVADARNVLMAVHHVPDEALLPPHAPPPRSVWAFARAYLGSGRMMRAIEKFPNVRKVVCGHSHFAARALIGGIEAVNIGSSYGKKRFLALEIE
jgi:hypothetical protein